MRVRSWQVLEVPELKAQLEGAGFEMQQAKDEIVRAQHEIQRAEAIHAAEHANYQRLLDTSRAQPGLVAQQELDDAQSKDLSSEAQVDAASPRLTVHTSMPRQRARTTTASRPCKTTPASWRR